MTDRAFEKWVAELPTEARYNFDSQGRGYKKDASVMMRLAWQAATAHERERCAQVCIEWADAHAKDTGICTYGNCDFVAAAIDCANAIRKGE